MQNEFKDGIRTEVDGAVLTVTLDRPKANAIDRAMSLRLNDIWRSLFQPRMGP